jgi:pimeloyl-ACP methyl ester carboxylesterase
MRRILLSLLSCFYLTTAGSQTPPFEVQVVGEGPAVLFLPGFASTSDVWTTAVESLSDQFECHLITYAGFGEVPRVENFPWLSKLKDGLQTYLAKEGLREVVVVGHSMGGTLALWLAADRTAEISRLIIVDGLPASGALMIPDYDSNALSYDSPWNQQMLEMDSVAFSGMADQMSRGMTSSEAGQQLIRNWMVQADRETYVYGYTDLLKLDLRDALAMIEVPVDILAATRPFSETVARKTYESQYAALEEYSLTFAEDAAHFIMFDRPDFFLEYLKEHLKN